MVFHSVPPEAAEEAAELPEEAAELLELLEEAALEGELDDVLEEELITVLKASPCPSKSVIIRTSLTVFTFTNGSIVA